MSLWLKIGGPQNDGLFRHSVTGKYKFRKYREGKGEIDRSLKTSDLAIARRRRDDLMAELWGEKPLKAKRQTVGEIWPLWYQGMKETKRKGTAESIKYAWQNLEPYAADLFLDDFTNEWWVNTYIQNKRQEPNKRKAIDNTRRKFFNEWKWASMFLKWCDENGKGSPGWKRPKLLNPDPPVDEGKVYSEDQLAALRSNATLRMSAFLEAGERHFMRRSEIRLLEWNRVDLEKRTIHLRAQDTKIKKPRTFPFNERLKGHFLELKEEARAMGLDSAFVFPSLIHTNVDQGMTITEFRTMWENCYEKSELPKGSRFHWLRHTGLTKATRVPGVNLAALCIFAGLSIEELQKTYLHYTTDDLRGVENLVGAA